MTTTTIPTTTKTSTTTTTTVTSTDIKLTEPDLSKSASLVEANTGDKQVNLYLFGALAVCVLFLLIGAALSLYCNRSKKSANKFNI